MTCKWREFIQNDDGVGSAARLNMVIGVLIGSIVVLWLAYHMNLGGEIFAVYMLATGGVYSWGKYRESAEKVEQIRADSPNQPPVVMPPSQPTTTINVGKSDELQAKDVSVKAAGNVTVTPKRKR